MKKQGNGMNIGGSEIVTIHIPKGTDDLRGPLWILKWLAPKQEFKRYHRGKIVHSFERVQPCISQEPGFKPELKLLSVWSFPCSTDVRVSF